MHLKVLHFYRTYFPDTQGGLEEAIRQTCLGTRPFGIESRMLTLSPDPVPAVLQLHEVEVTRVRLDLEITSCSMGIGAFAQFRQLADWADVLHFHFPWPFADLVKLASGSRKPCVVTYHSDIVRQRLLRKLYAPLMYQFLGSMDAIVATSPNYLATSAVLKKYAKKVQVIPICLEETSYPVVADTELEAARNQYGADFFLFLGVLREYKGLHILLDAIRNAPFRVLVVGIGPLEHELRARAAELGIDNVQFIGYVSDSVKVALLKLCRALVMPSHLRSEAFGISLLEGAMSARPLISAEIGTGTSFVNIENDTGLVIPPDDAVALRGAMQRLHDDAESARGLGANARRRFEQHFTAARMGDAYATLYRHLHEQHKKRAIPRN